MMPTEIVTNEFSHSMNVYLLCWIERSSRIIYKSSFHHCEVILNWFPSVIRVIDSISIQMSQIGSVTDEATESAWIIYYIVNQR